MPIQQHKIKSLCNLKKYEFPQIIPLYEPIFAVQNLSTSQDLLIDLVKLGYSSKNYFTETRLKIYDKSQLLSFSEESYDQCQSSYQPTSINKSRLLYKPKFTSQSSRVIDIQQNGNKYVNKIKKEVLLKHDDILCIEMKLQYKKHNSSTIIQPEPIELTPAEKKQQYIENLLTAIAQLETDLQHCVEDYYSWKSHVDFRDYVSSDGSSWYGPYSCEEQFSRWYGLMYVYEECMNGNCMGIDFGSRTQPGNDLQTIEQLLQDCIYNEYGYMNSNVNFKDYINSFGWQGPDKCQNLYDQYVLAQNSSGQQQLATQPPETLEESLETIINLSITVEVQYLDQN